MEEEAKKKRVYGPKQGIVSTQLPLDTRDRLRRYCEAKSVDGAVLTPCRLLRRLTEAHLASVGFGPEIK